MNNRERLLAILNRQAPDRIPWIPRLLLWYQDRVLNHTLPKEFEGLSLREIERKLRIGTPARDGKVFAQRYEGVEVVTRMEGGKRITEYHTPVGSVRTAMHYSADLEARGLPGRVEEWPLKGPADYKVWEWIAEHTYWDATYDAYRAYDAEIGGDGLPMVSIGDVPIHDFFLELAGYDDAYFQWADYRPQVEHLLSVITEAQRERLWPVVANSPAKLLLHGMHLSTQFTPPNLWDKYILPYYDGFMSICHAHGQAVAMHADNDTLAILQLIERAGWDMVECFVTAPMVPTTLEQARRAWGDRVIIWGALPSLLFSPSIAEDEFRTYVRGVFRTLAPGKAIILGIADNAMPDSFVERVRWVSNYVEEHGDYPLR